MLNLSAVVLNEIQKEIRETGVGDESTPDTLISF